MPTKTTGVINDVSRDDSDGKDESDSDGDDDEDNLKGLPKLLKCGKEYGSSDDEDCSDSEDESKDDQGDDPPLEDTREEITEEQDVNEGGSVLSPPLGRGHRKRTQTTSFVSKMEASHTKWVIDITQPPPERERPINPSTTWERYTSGIEGRSTC